MAMARQLWLLRHADAEPHGSRRDDQRQLTERGKRHARAVAAALARMDLTFGAILSSPKARARETAELVLAGMSDSQRELLELHPLLAGRARAREVLELQAASQTEGPLLVVGHEPDLSGIVAELTGARVDLKKAGLAVVRLGAGGGELVLLLRPAELALIADIVVAEV